MNTSKLCANYKIFTRCGFYNQIQPANCKPFEPVLKDQFQSNNNFYRKYHFNSSSKFLTVTFHNHYISKRSLSIENYVSYQSGIFKYLSQCAPTNHVKDFIVLIHDSSGLPWWATVILTTVILRTLIALPLAAYQASIIARLENIRMLEMPEIAKDLKKETALKVKEFSWPPKKANLYYRINLRKKYNTLVIRDNCHPFKTAITVWFQFPTWIFFTAALRNMAYMLPVRNAGAEQLFIDLATGGFFWIPNLTQPDGLLIFPVLLGLSNLAIIEIQTMMRLHEATRFQRYATNFFRGFSILLIPISATVPSVLCLYWTTSSLVGLGQNLLLMSNKVRKMCKIPETPTTYDYPYQQLIFEIKEKNRRLFSFLRRKS